MSSNKLAFEESLATEIRDLKAEVQRLRDSRNFWLRQAQAFSEHADNMRLALMEHADECRREDIIKYSTNQRLK